MEKCGDLHPPRQDGPHHRIDPYTKSIKFSHVAYSYRDRKVCKVSFTSTS